MRYRVRYEARDATLCDAKLRKRVEDILIERQGEIHSVAGLCNSLRGSRNTLQHSLNDILRLAPHVYLGKWRFARAGEDLVSGDAHSVTAVANDWGFLGPGRFAGYYRSLFGELPYDTLRKQ